MKKKSHKAEFINNHGQEMWKLFQDYHNGDRSPEATHANTLYNRIIHGGTREVYSVYGVLEGDTVIYIGSTSQTVAQRWKEHKSDARTLRKKATMALHTHMNTVSTNHDIFPEFNIVTFHEVDNEDNAKMLEKALIVALKTNIHGYNKMVGGGSKSILKRPISQPNDLQTR